MTSLKDDLEELLNCSICLGIMTEPKLLPCSHRFCQECIMREMDRSATSGGNPSFPCPLCKRTVSLQGGRTGQEWIVQFETDRLLKDIMDRLEKETEATSDVCYSHKKPLEIVCYTCSKTGCVTCAWVKHRYCDAVKDFSKESERIKHDLEHQLYEVKKCIHIFTPPVKKWTAVWKSLHSQLMYSNNFLKSCIEEKRSKFNARCSRMFKLFDIYIKRTLMTKEMKRDISRIRKSIRSKLDIRSKYSETMTRLSKQNNSFLEHVRKASVKMKTFPSIKSLEDMQRNISKTLKLDRREMVIRGEKIVTNNEDLLSSRYRAQNIENIDTSSAKFLVDGLITRGDQVDLQVEVETELVEKMTTILEEADRPTELKRKLYKLLIPKLSESERQLVNRHNVRHEHPINLSGPQVPKSRRSRHRNKEYQVNSGQMNSRNYDPILFTGPLDVHHKRLRLPPSSAVIINSNNPKGASWKFEIIPNHAGIQQARASFRNRYDLMGKVYEMSIYEDIGNNEILVSSLVMDNEEEGLGINNNEKLVSSSVVDKEEEGPGINKLKVFLAVLYLCVCVVFIFFYSLYMYFQ